MIEIIKRSKSYTAVAKEFFGHSSGNTIQKVRDHIEANNINIDHFLFSAKKQSDKKCPVCGKEFKTKVGHPREKTTCSYSCSNTYFRSGKDNPNCREDAYRTTCFLHHEKKCIICGEDKIVEVHHFDADHSNNNAENLIPLCPTHHAYWHSSYKNLIEDAVVRYKDSFKMIS